MEEVRRCYLRRNYSTEATTTTFLKRCCVARHALTCVHGCESASLIGIHFSQVARTSTWGIIWSGPERRIFGNDKSSGTLVSVDEILILAGVYLQKCQ